MEAHNPQKILLVGLGNMGKALIAPVAHKHGEAAAGVQLTVVSPNTKPDFPCAYFSSLGQLEGQGPFDLILLCCKPFHVQNVCKELSAHLTDANTVLVSILAGIELATLRECTKHLQGVVVRMMPNLAVQVRKGISVILDPEPSASALIRKNLAFLNDLGTVVYAQDEKEFDALAVISGCGTGYISGLVAKFASAWTQVDGSYLILHRVPSAC